MCGQARKQWPLTQDRVELVRDGLPADVNIVDVAFERSSWRARRRSETDALERTTMVELVLKKAGLDREGRRVDTEEVRERDSLGDGGSEGPDGDDLVAGFLKRREGAERRLGESDVLLLRGEDEQRPRVVLDLGVHMEESSLGHASGAEVLAQFEEGLAHAPDRHGGSVVQMSEVEPEFEDTGVRRDVDRVALVRLVVKLGEEVGAAN